jgi:hypothetical protein
MAFAARFLVILLTPLLAWPSAVGQASNHSQPGTYLAWTAGGLPSGFRGGIERLPQIRRSVVVASGTAWLTQAESAHGHLQSPPHGLAYPVEVAAVDPSEFEPFLPQESAGTAEDVLERGEAILGSSAARVRGMGAGSTLTFGSVPIRIGVVLPDSVVGAKELVVSRASGRRLGIVRDRYALLRLRTPMSDRGVTALVRRILPPGTLLRIRGPGGARFLREADAAIPSVRLKLVFGEFAAKPDGGYLQMDEAWERRNIAIERVPILGRVRCNVVLFQPLRDALEQVVRQGLADLVKPSEYGGCYSPRFAMRDPAAGISHHSWGAAIDLNVAENPYGATPTMDPKVVHIFEHWGFTWGGRWLIPDGMHFEYGDPVPTPEPEPPSRPWPRV